VDIASVHIAPCFTILDIKYKLRSNYLPIVIMQLVHTFALDKLIVQSHNSRFMRCSNLTTIGANLQSHVESMRLFSRAGATLLSESMACMAAQLFAVLQLDQMSGP
jgi:hypothetical protein